MDGLSSSAFASFIVNRETGELEARQGNEERRAGNFMTRIRNSLRESRARAESVLNPTPTTSASDDAGFTVNGRIVTEHFTRVGREGILNQPTARIDVAPANATRTSTERTQEIPLHERQLSVILATNYGMTLRDFHRLIARRNEGMLNDMPQYDDSLPSYESCNEYRDIFLAAIRENEQQQSTTDASQMPETEV